MESNNNIENNSNPINLIVFEFFSGIGGMHEALKFQNNNINIISF